MFMFKLYFRAESVLLNNLTEHAYQQRSEHLGLNNFGLDLLFDFEKGLPKHVGGRRQKQPPNVSAGSAVDMESLNPTDRTLCNMYAWWMMLKANFAFLEGNGYSQQELTVLSDV